MFSIISTMFLGIGIGYGLRNWSILQKTEKTISLTIFLLLFIVSGVLGSLLAARLVLQLFFKKGGKQ